MASLFSLFSLLIIIPIAFISECVSSYQFDVGGEKGWTKPSKNETESYNFWASENRFHIGDTLYFKYKNDSVLLVNYTDYRDCIASNPISKYENGNNTIFRFDQSGVFCFISGELGHCMAGQKLVVKVMAATVETAPSPSPDGDDESDGSDGWDSFNWGPPSLNSTVKTTLASYFVTALGGFLIVLYYFT